MNDTEKEVLHKDIMDILPENTGFILITLPIGVPSHPTFISNMEPKDSARTMHAVVGVIDEREKEQGLGLQS